MNPQPGNKIIDVAAGTGDLAKMISTKNDNKNNFCCVEPNKEMLETGQKKLKSPISDISSAPTLQLPRHSSIQSLPYSDDDYESTVKCIFCHQHIPLDVLEFHATTYHPKELTYYYCHRQTIQEQNENVTYVACRYHATTLNELNIHINSTHDYPVAETQYILTTQ